MERKRLSLVRTLLRWNKPRLSEMTYFLTPQTNSTFNRSQRICQTAFCPCSLSNAASSGVGLLRHNAEDGRFTGIYVKASEGSQQFLYQLITFKIGTCGNNLPHMAEQSQNIT